MTTHPVDTSPTEHRGAAAPTEPGTAPERLEPEQLLALPWREHAARLAEVATDGLDPRWRPIMADTPRQVFIPAFWAFDEYNSPAVLTDPADPDYLTALYRDEPLVTAWTPTTLSWGPTVRTVTSSASVPSVVATMLDRLAPAPGDRVLEIGTGTGYNAALLSTAVGDDHVTSIDITADLVETARTRLAALGHHPHLHTGDGTADLPGTGLFDRIIATCAVGRIPTSWIHRLAPGGRIVAPLTMGGALAVLDRPSTPPQTTGDVVAVTGWIDAAEVRFMHARSGPDAPIADWVAPGLPAADPGTVQHGRTDVDPAALDDDVLRLWLSLHHPTAHITYDWADGRATAVIVYTGQDRAVVDLTSAVPGLWAVRQQGHRLWDTVETTWRTWQRAGRPGRDHLQITARTDGTQHVHLDEQYGRISWPLSTP